MVKEMEIVIDRRGEGLSNVKMSVSVRSLDTRTHSLLTGLTVSTREAVTAALVRAGLEVEQIIAQQQEEERSNG